MENLKLLEEVRVLRKLGITESIYDNEVLNRNFILSKILIISLDEPYSINVSLVRQTSSKWIRRHELLSSKIRCQDFINLNKSPKFFVEKRETNENVEFFEMTESLNLVDTVEIEVKTPFNSEIGQLWRMKIFKLFNSNEYIFMLTVHHGLADGKNLNALLVEYLKILQELLVEKIVKDEEKEDKSEFCEFSLEDLIFRQKEAFVYIPNLIERSVAGDMITPRNLKDDTYSNAYETHGKFDFFKLEPVKLEKLIF